MKNLVVFPLLMLVFIIQSAVASRIPLLSGTIDLPLLFLAAWALQERVEVAWTWATAAGVFASFFSALPPVVYFGGYFIVVLLARFIQRQVWQLPILAMFTLSFLGTILMHSLSFLALRFLGSPILLEDALSLITLPTLFLNFLLAIPVHSLMRDLAVWVYPSEEFV
jgi:rod shape-determining protein MreD